MKAKTLILFFAALFTHQIAFAISLSSSFHLFSEGVIFDSTGEQTSIHTKILCRQGSVTCTFTEFYEGKDNAYDLLVPWFMDDDYSAPGFKNVTIIYQTGNIVYNQQVIGKAHAIHQAFGSPEAIEFFVPLRIDSQNRTLLIGQ